MSVRVTEFQLTRTQTIWVRVEVPNPEHDAAALGAVSGRSAELWREYDSDDDEFPPVAYSTRDVDPAMGGGAADLSFDGGGLVDFVVPATAPRQENAYSISGVEWATCGAALVRMDTALRRTYWRRPGNPSAGSIAKMLSAPLLERVDLPTVTDFGGEPTHIIERGEKHGLDPDLLVDMREGDELWRADVGTPFPVYAVVRGGDVVAVVASKRLVEGDTP